MELDDIKSLTEGFIPYTERHFQRLSRLQQVSGGGRSEGEGVRGDAARREVGVRGDAARREVGVRGDEVTIVIDHLKVTLLT